MAVKYEDLPKETIDEICEMYCITNDKATRHINEVELVANVREMIRDLADTILKYLPVDGVHHLDLWDARKEVASKCSDIVTEAYPYVINSKAGRIMKKLLFVNNLAVEAERVKDFMKLALLPEGYEEFVPIFDFFMLRVRGLISKELINNNTVEAFKDKLATAAFRNFCDKYYLEESIFAKAKSSKEEYEMYVATFCGPCTRADCTSNGGCNHLDARDELEKEAKLYDGLSFLMKRMKLEPFSTLTADEKVIAKIKEPELMEVARRMLLPEGPGLRCKYVVFGSTPKQLVSISEKMVKKIAQTRLQKLAEVGYNGIEAKVAQRILESDFANTSADKIEEGFDKTIENYEAIEDAESFGLYGKKQFEDSENNAMTNRVFSDEQRKYE